MLFLLGFSLLPVVLFTIFLVFADSFKLISLKTWLYCLLWGVLAALIAEAINLQLENYFSLSFRTYSRYLAPLIEEPLKLALLVLLVRRGRIGFMIDAAIYGFSIGAVFSIYENIRFFHDPGTTNPMVLIIRGFGTSLMHGGCTALGIMILIRLQESIRIQGRYLLAAIVSAIIVHSLYNHFLINPIISTILIILLLPPLLVWIFQVHENKLHEWMELELTSEIELLKMIREGQLGQSKAGEYISRLKSRFNPETIVDMLCYIEVYTDLSVKAKSRMLLREAGLTPEKDSDISGKLIELKSLEKRIGHTGRIAIAPVFRLKRKDIWKLNQFE